MLQVRTFFLLFWVSLLGGCATSNAVQYETPTINIPLVSAIQLQIDARLSEPVWMTQAARLTLSDYWGQKSHPIEPTEVLLLDTGNSLVIAFLSEDSYIRVDPSRKHDGETFRDDCVEIFFSRPEQNPEESIGFEVNPNGVYSDLRVWSVERLDDTWNAAPDIRVATARVDSLRPWSKVATGAGWIMQMEIPWEVIRAGLGLPSPSRPNKIRANFARWNHAAKGWGIFTIWSDSGLPFPKPHAPARTGWLLME